MTSAHEKLPDKTDVLVVGAGPAGLAAALKLAESGSSILLVDSRKRIGHPIRCAEITGLDYFDKMGVEPRPGWMRVATVSWKDIPVIILNREKTESGIAEIAAKRGAIVRTSTSVVAVGEFDGNGRRVTLINGKNTQTIFTRCVIAADGVSSYVARCSGIDTYLPPSRVATGVAFRVSDVNLKYPERIYNRPLPPPLSKIPYYYFWVVPNGNREANIGLGVPGPGGFKALILLRKMMAESDALSGGRVVQTIVGILPDAPPLAKPFGDGLLVTGGAARMLDPLTGGGISTAVLSGSAAADTLIEVGGAVTTRDRLNRYPEKIKNTVYLRLERQWKKRRRQEQHPL
ncbi:MAG: NAD(P)/FAD-dependent oxidoreductase [Deltaproteobacteria bacterium]|nr:NAD(P)/FAD-dependent oxidoreductase [Deltaproteobacteria bacterium]